MNEAEEDSVSDVNLNSSTMTEEEREEIQQELAKVCVHHTHPPSLEKMIILLRVDWLFLVTSWKRRSAP